MSVDLNQKWIQDVRMPVAGDSYSWYSVEGKDVKDTLVIHHSASEVDDAFSIANYHVNHNGWGGIGYHFVICKDGTIQYAGDLATMRAHVEGQNQHKVGICLVGNMLNHTPTDAQLRSARKLIDFLIAPNDILPKVNGYEAVEYHNHIQGQATACPGWQAPFFSSWFNYLKGGEFPAVPYTAPVPTPAPLPEPHPEPVVVTVPEPEPTPVPEPPVEPAPVPEAPQEEPKEERKQTMEDFKARLLSRKFLLAVLAAATLLLQGHIDQAVVVVLAYLGVNVIAEKTGK